MAFNIVGAKAQMPVSAQVKEFILEYEADMADAHAKEYFEFVKLSEVEKLDWIMTNDDEVYKTFINKLDRMTNGD